MNCQQIRNIWDDYRDGQLTDSPRYSFERHLRGCPHCAELWAFETQWLEKIGSDEADVETQPQAAPGPRFVLAVVDHWQNENRGRFRLSQVRWLAIAASIAIVAVTGVVLAALHPADTRHAPMAVANAAAPRIKVVPPVPAVRDDPVGRFVVQVSDGIERQPAQIREAIGDAVSMISLENIVDALERTEPAKKNDGERAE